jgi:hypothetical protein
MKPPYLIAVIFSAVALYGCGSDSFLGRAEQSCLKYPVPGPRAECTQRAKEDMAAFEKETAKSRDLVKAKGLAEIQAQEAAASVVGDGTGADQADAAGTSKADDKKKNGLCFKRAATGEMVCPN